jgi:hypothetical protein
MRLPYRSLQDWYKQRKMGSGQCGDTAIDQARDKSTEGIQEST